MLHSFSRTEILIGTEALEKLKNSKVAVFGIGGVGTFAVEALARSGVGELVLVDDDDICLTNINRQIHATRKTVGKAKVEVMKERILDINPDVKVTIYKKLYNSETAEELLSDDYDYVIDAIDMVSAKLDLIERCKNRDIPIISAMGAGNKLNPTMLEVEDIYKTSICPLAKVMRRELKRRNIKDLKVVYSKEKPITPLEIGGGCKTNCICPNKDENSRSCTVRRQIPGSVSFVPSVSGLIIASEVVKDITKERSSCNKKDM
ncbi:molybdopterin/thiamine biosynthesis protein ThiF [Gottschalkia acidurici 9a]|uniref:Molybdopterin/thiamine biosynthesis protein ThiF n=1 Tax=Gottschalkia acidurici (strain ATCC 7906 / DSM 604 / BCRC 14475 / CIP 104303 / KCTC 5404 / NCIMB 10678 / 9a) TaxID=1128398 RepID=K0B194_GOTA9|nr:tRNA threonylcarbamoyladenosine dehydratase [Gottschalkia acidurici]AFS78735.1 molybdopterin/thiamine biosynthesis protein ThiF [Gottschalkia acidurici 9a]